MSDTTKVFLAGKRLLPPGVTIQNLLLSYHYILDNHAPDFREVINHRRKANGSEKSRGSQKAGKRRRRGDE